MNTRLTLTAGLVALLAQAAAAKPRHVGVAHVNPPSRSSGSSGSGGGSGTHAASPVYYGTPPSAAPAAAAQPAAASNRVVFGSPMSNTRGFSGGSSARHAGGGSFWGQRIARKDDGGAGSPPADPGAYGIPSVLMPGQLIRTAGLGALTSAPDSPGGMFAYEAGPIRYEESKGTNLTTHVGVFTGPKDTPPRPNTIGMPYGNSGGSAGGNGITENNIQFNSHSNNGNGNGTGGGNGQGN